MELQLEIQGVAAERGGRLLVYLFGRDGFPKIHAASLQQASCAVPVANGQMSAKAGATLRTSVKTELSGDIAVKIVHDDENGDGVIRKRFGFLPDMGIGYSRGARISWRLPRFEEAALRLDPQSLEQLRVPIRLQYLF